MLKCASSKKTADHITKFMDWFRQNGPAVRDLAGRQAELRDRLADP